MKIMLKIFILEIQVHLKNIKLKDYIKDPTKYNLVKIKKLSKMKEIQKKQKLNFFQKGKKWILPLNKEQSI